MPNIYISKKLTSINKMEHLSDNFTWKQFNLKQRLIFIPVNIDADLCQPNLLLFAFPPKSHIPNSTIPIFKGQPDVRYHSHARNPVAEN